MTGTASELYEFNNCSSNRLTNTELFTSWLSEKINADCLQSGMSQQGCSILIPKKYPNYRCNNHVLKP